MQFTNCRLSIFRHSIAYLSKRNNIVTFNRNYTLYSYMSLLVVTMSEEMASTVKIYSIEKTFMTLQKSRKCNVLKEFGSKVIAKILQWKRLTVDV